MQENDSSPKEGSATHVVIPSVTRADATARRRRRRPRERLSALDSMFLLMETPVQSLHVGSVLILEGPALDPARFRDLVSARVAAVPILHRTVLRMPFELGRPIWADAPDFRPADHVRSIVLDGAGDTRDLQEAVARIMEPRLDPGRPLWEVWQVRGLTGGRWAVVAKAHHTMVDGESGVDLVGALLSDTPEGVPAPSAATASLPVPTAAELVGDLLAWLVRLPLRTARLAVRALKSPQQAIQHMRRVRYGLAQVIRPDLPPTVLTGPLGPARTWGWAETGLDGVRDVAGRAGGTVNDVFLAALAGAYRQFLLDRGEPLEGIVLRTIVPVRGPRAGRLGPARNLASALFVELPIHLPDAPSRLAAVMARTAEQKSRSVPEATAAVVAAADHLPAPLLARATTVYGRSRQGRVNGAATNVRGPDRVQFLAGRRVLELIAYVPVALSVRATAAMVTYAGRLTVAITADAAALPDADRLIAALRREFELLGASRPSREA